MPYKATYNYKCLDQTYEIGQEYKIDEKPQICVKGFHYCINAKNVLKHYPIRPNFKLLEIEDLSYDTVHVSDKSCSNHIKILREINDPDELMKLIGRNFTYDQENKILEINGADGFYKYILFDDHNNIIRTVDSTKSDLIDWTNDKTIVESNKRWLDNTFIDYLMSKEVSICSYLPYIPLNN
jgi:hypothetical protein